jgi:hypothetical protein
MNFNNQNFDYLSLVQTLSTSLQAATSAFNTPSFRASTQELLSGLQFTQAQAISALDAVTEQLSSLPMHPYQRMIYNFFGPDYKFKTFDDVPEPDYIPAQECVKYINEKMKGMYDTCMHNLTCNTNQQIHMAFGSLSGEEVVYDYDKQRGYLEFFEMLRRVDPQHLLPGKVEVLSKKIISEYLKVI